jgi:hypothetical protein
MTDEQKDGRRDWQRRYAKGEGKPRYRIGAYRYFDKERGLECDLDAKWFKEHIQSKPCIYCGESGFNGCDRIDNSFGHTKANVVPCCAICNTTRMDTFTHEEMKLLGIAVKQIKIARLQNASDPGDLCNRRPSASRAP